MLNALGTRLRDLIWAPQADVGNPSRRAAVHAARVLDNVVQDFMEGQLTLRAMSLVYTTILSLVPLLAFSFSILKAFDVHNRIEPLLLTVLEPLGAQAEMISDHIIGFVENMQVGVLGSLGLGLLLYTVISLIQKIEASFNFIWRVQRGRALTRRFSDYISVLLIAPLLYISATGVATTVLSNSFMQWITEFRPLGAGVYLATQIMPFAVITLTFTLTYIFLPNTRVRALPALIGGLSAAVIWQIVGQVFAVFATSSTRFDAIYSSFAILILLLIWLYLAWLILLIGAQIAFYVQHPELVRRHRLRRPLAAHNVERIGLGAAYLVAEAFHRRSRPPDDQALAERLHIGAEQLGPIVELLVESRILLPLGDDQRGYVPATDLEQIRLRDILHCLRHGREASESEADTPAAVAWLGRRLDEATQAALGHWTLKDLVAESGAGATENTIELALSSAPVATDRQQEGRG